MEEQKKTFYIRRIIFALVALAVAVPLALHLRMPMTASWPAQSLYDQIEKVPADKIVIVSANWDAGTQGESAPQVTALIHHLAKSRKRFAIWGWVYPPGPELTQRIAESITGQYGRQYGVDWVNWGYTTGGDPMIRGWAKDIVTTLKTDFKRQRLNTLPFMQNVRSAKDIGMIVEVSGSQVGGVPTVQSYIGLIHGVYGTPVGYACTGVMVSDAFPFLDSKQLVGMMRGLVGAAEYETLVGHPGAATMRMSAQSFAHVLIILLIIAGNIGYFMRRGLFSQRREPASRAQNL